MLLPSLSCLSSCSYIKPQPKRCKMLANCVVYHLVPTSNHNFYICSKAPYMLFIILFLHQTTTVVSVPVLSRGCLSSCSYIKPQHEAVHLLLVYRCLSSCSYIKPQRRTRGSACSRRCLSSCSYIKPQLLKSVSLPLPVVYHLVPTSNHNSHFQAQSKSAVVYHLVPTSNHNPIAVNLLAISKILCFKLLRNGRAGRILLQKY